MILRKSLLVGVLALATICLAQNRPEYAAHGRGWAVNEATQRAKFQFETAKPVGGAVRGRLEISTKTADSGVVLTARVSRLGVAKPNAEFGGPAVLVIRTRGSEPIRVEGTVVANVSDNRRPGGSTGRDRIGVRFTGGDRTWSFAGGVADGDIVVIDNR